MLTKKFKKVKLAHTPTSLEAMPNLTEKFGGPHLWVKRDDLTGLAMGGNKARQLEFYLGDAQEKGADTILTHGAIQSNHVRMAIAAARRFGFNIEVMLEERIADTSTAYQESGNMLLNHLMGAVIHRLPPQTSEEDVEAALYRRADEIKDNGGNPYVISLGNEDLPLGGLGYVLCADELLNQCKSYPIDVQGIVVASGSGTTHAGLLTGLRALGSEIPVYGFCVGRNKQEQFSRVFDKCQKLSAMIEQEDIVTEADILLDDRSFHPGYAKYNDYTLDAIYQCAQQEGLLLDPAYTGKTMAGLLHLVSSGHFEKGENVIFMHTGGSPGIFAYPEIAPAEVGASSAASDIDA